MQRGKSGRRGGGGGTTPKYQRITAALRDELRGLEPGTRLDAERVLAERFDVSRMTLRQALDVLADERWVLRIVGSGTFVSRPIVAMGPKLTSFTEDMQAQGLTPSSNLLGFDVRSADPEIAGALHVPAGSPVVWMERLRLADGEPICLEGSHFPGSLQPVLEAGDVEASVHDLLRQSGLEITSLRRQVCARAASTRTAKLLGLPGGSPVLEVLDTFAGSEGRVLQYVRSIYRPERHVVTSQGERVIPSNNNSAGAS